MGKLARNLAHEISYLKLNRLSTWGTAWPSVLAVAALQSQQASRYLEVSDQGLWASPYLSGVSGRGIASSVARAEGIRVGIGKSYNRTCAANAMPSLNGMLFLCRKRSSHTAVFGVAVYFSIMETAHLNAGERVKQDLASCRAISSRTHEMDANNNWMTNRRETSNMHVFNQRMMKRSKENIAKCNASTVDAYVAFLQF